MNSWIPYNGCHGNNSAHDPLDAIKALVLERGLNALTKSASDNARLMGLDRVATVSVVLSLQRGMLFKSMTTRADHRVWQACLSRPLSQWQNGLHQSDDSSGCHSDSIQGEMR
jgi:motility quorum-sensing regulator/GCU-specific mRNA interferase toxin